MVAAYLLTVVNFPHVITALFIGMIAAAVVGFLVGLIALRRTGIYFAMITVAIAEVFLLRRIQSALGLYRRRERASRRADADAHLGFTTMQFDTDWSLYRLPGVLVFRRHRDRAAHRAFAGRRRAPRDPRQSAARGRRRPQHSQLQADRLRHRGRLCRLCRRPARRHARLHAARRLHVRHLRPIGDADGDRRRRHAVRPAARRCGLALSAAISCRRRCISAPPGSSCSAWCSCCWSASCAAG